MERHQRRRLGARGGGDEVKRHVFWDNLNWQMLEKKQIEPPFRPKLTKDKNGVWGTTNFDPEFTGKIKFIIFSLFIGLTLSQSQLEMRMSHYVSCYFHESSFTCAVFVLQARA